MKTTTNTANYSIKIWMNENSRSETRTNIPFGLAYALATKAGFYKSQIISEFGVVEIETRNDF